VHKKGRNALTICAAAVLAFAALTATTEQTAEACGGFFCDSSQPINQQAERIIFSENADDTVTAVVQILYQGPADEFAWVLPVSGSPDVGVSSDAAFQRIQRATAPTYRMNTTVEGTCAAMPDSAAGGFDAGASAQDTSTSSDASGGGVTVVNQGAVGPYDYTTIAVDPTASDAAQVAVDWLTTNGYDVTSVGADLIRPYLEDGMNLIAFKLTKSASSGDIRPVKLTYPAELPMIPIKLTAVAANDDMGVLVWVLGDSRSVPSNYRSLELNDALINWFNPNSNYNDVVTQAANEANGQGFVTEYADDATNINDVVFSGQDESMWTSLNDPALWQNDHGELITRTFRRFSTLDGFNLVVEESVPLPADATVQDFLNCPSCVIDSSGTGTDAGFNSLPTQIEGFSPSAFLSSVEEHVIAPMQETEALIDSRPYITRLYTTMSASDMTIDPIFDFNSTLPDFSNTHIAERTIYCSPAVSRNEAPWKTELPSGEEVHGQGNSWPLGLDDGMPATRLVRQEHNTGSGDTIDDNTDSIAGSIDEHNQSISLDPGDVDADTGGTSDSGSDSGGSGSNIENGANSGSDDGGGCQVVDFGGPVGGGLLMMVFVGMGLIRRRD
jgi:hypothetical protein